MNTKKRKNKKNKNNTAILLPVNSTIELPRAFLKDKNGNVLCEVDPRTFIESWSIKDKNGKEIIKKDNPFFCPIFKDMKLVEKENKNNYQV